MPQAQTHTSVPKQSRGVVEGPGDAVLSQRGVGREGVYLMQHVLVEVAARSPLVGVESLQVHAQLGVPAPCPLRALVGALRSWSGPLAGCCRLGSEPRGPAASVFSTGQLPRRRASAPEQRPAAARPGPRSWEFVPSGARVL